MESIIEQILIDKLNNHLKLLFNVLEEKYGSECGFTSETLFKDYGINSIHSTKNYKRKIQSVAPLNLDLETKCNARVWGSSIPRVVFNTRTKCWEYGLQCRRNKHHNSSYCGIHKKTRPHGNILERPPHDAFERHKKIDLKIRVEK